MKALWIALACIVLASCSKGLDKKFNGSSESAFESSLASIRKGISSEESAQLDRALLALAVSDVSIGYEGGILGAYEKLRAAKSPEQLAAPLAGTVDGKTGREVVEAGSKRLREEAARQLAVTDREIGLLKQLREENAAKKSALDGIEVQDATLRFSAIGPEKMSVMDFKVRNGTATGLSQLFLKGTVSEPAGGKVLLSEEFNYKLSESPLLPGATKPLRLPHGGRSKWVASEFWGREDLAFRIELVNAEDLSGQKLTPAFTSKDVARLVQLEANKAALAKLAAP